MRILGNREDAEDAVQSAITRAVERLCGFREESAFGTWFTSIVVRLCIDHERRRRVRPAPLPLDQVAREPASSEHGSLRRLLHRETAGAVERELARLPVRIRTALVLRTLEDMPYPDLAETLGITVRTARMYVFEARKRLAAALSPILDDEAEDPR